MHPFKALKDKFTETYHHPVSVDPMSVDTICIPFNGSPISLIRINLRLTTLEAPITSMSDNSLSYKYNIQLVPDLPRCTDWDEKDWEKRKLIDLGQMNPDQHPKKGSDPPGPYLMYTSYCTDPKWMPYMLNKHFEGIKGVEPVYGSVYIFKLKLVMGPDDRSSTYEDLNESFINSAFKGRGIAHSESLKWLATQNG